MILSEARGGGNLGAIFAACSPQPDTYLAATASSLALGGEEGEEEAVAGHDDGEESALRTVESAGPGDVEVEMSSGEAGEEVSVWWRVL